MFEQDQNKFIENALQNVKNSSIKMKNSIDRNDMRTTLKNASEMISELKTNLLSPKNYYQLFTAIFDELIYLQNYFKEDSKKGRRFKELYEAVQQSISIIPRVYLLITVGKVFIESGQCDKNEIIYDMIQMTKGVQNPIRGLFSRYFLLKMLKDYLINIDDLIDNFKDMNRLWIRIKNTQNLNKDKINSIRNELKVLVGENITRLADFPEINIEIYKNQILFPLLKAIIDCNDEISQEYVLECIIHAFPDEFNIICMDEILSSLTEMNENFDIKNIFITILDKLGKFNSIEKKKELKTNEIFEKLNNAINFIFQENKKNDGNLDIMKLIELQCVYLKFVINFNTFDEDDKKFNIINKIIENTFDLLNKNIGNRRLSKEGMRLISKLLTNLMEGPISIFKFKNFPDLMGMLDEEFRSVISLQIINSLVKEKNKSAISNKEKMEIMIEFIKPMIIFDYNNINNDSQFEYQQNIISKLIYAPFCNDPFEQFEMFKILKEAFFYFAKDNNVEIGNKKLTIYIQVIINSLLLFISKISESYFYNKNKENNKLNNNKIYFRTFFLLEKFENENSFYDFFNEILKLINSLLHELENINIILTFKLSIQCAFTLNNLKLLKENFSEKCFDYLDKSIIILSSEKIENNEKFNLIIQMIGTLNEINIISLEKYKILIEKINEFPIKLNKRNEQCKLMLNLSNLYYNKINKENEKVIFCLKEAKKFAEYSLTNPLNTVLFINILNYYIKFDLIIENFNKIANIDDINDLIDKIKNYIITIQEDNKIENKNEILNKIKKYFNDTMIYIKNINDKKLEKVGQLIKLINTNNI